MPNITYYKEYLSQKQFLRMVMFNWGYSSQLWSQLRSAEAVNGRRYDMAILRVELL